MSAPIVITMASAPWAGTLLTTWTGSYSSAYIALGIIAALAATLAIASMP